MRRSLIPDRWEKIITMVEQQGSATIEEMATILGISEATVRRDLVRIRPRQFVRDANEYRADLIFDNAVFLGSIAKFG